MKKAKIFFVVTALIAGIAHADIQTVSVEYESVAVPTAVVTSVSMRANNPTIMDVDFIVHSSEPKVAVRVLAFKDGTRAFANVITPKTFVDNTGTNVGDNVTANVPLRISWNVAADWDATLARVSFFAMAMSTSEKAFPVSYHKRYETRSKTTEYIPVIDVPYEVPWAVVNGTPNSEHRDNLYTEKDEQRVNALLWNVADEKLSVQDGVLSVLDASILWGMDGGDNYVSYIDGMSFYSCAFNVGIYRSGEYYSSICPSMYNYFDVMDSTLHENWGDISEAAFNRRHAFVETFRNALKAKFGSGE